MATKIINSERLGRCLLAAVRRSRNNCDAHALAWRRLAAVADRYYISAEALMDEARAFDREAAR